MKLCVIGLGYVGLPVAIVFASRGLKVVGVDINVEKIIALNKGKLPSKELGLSRLFAEVAKNGMLNFSGDISSGVQCSDVVILAVPTPIRDGLVDLRYLTIALEDVRAELHKGQLIVIESTIPPGTTFGFVKPFLEASGLKIGVDIYLAHVPERIAPGRAIEELLNSPRVVGGADPESTRRAIEVYSKVNPNLYPTDATTAEFVKLIENAFRDINIAYANLLALIAQNIGVDAYEAIRLANTHPRVNIHMPGAGVGGPCLTKDPYMLASLFGEFWGTELIKLARRINEYMPSHMVGLVEKALSENGVELRGARVAVLGAAYKGGVDDTRESPSRRVVKELLEIGLDVVVYDPYTPESFGAKRVDSLENAVGNADAIVIVTDHPEFKTIDLDMLSKKMRNRIIIDGRRVIDPYRACESGFKYYGIGFGRMFKL
ncbi:MAG: nucleotide sugar dehydrogenase [Thermoproteota archaeon]|nr:nucleotide sugar dehydrogenase [Candidatus Brockarchaeota archaeon]